MTDLIDTTEMYLKTIYELTEEGIVPLRARIAERLGHSGPTVSQTVARMERDGLVVVTGDRHLELTHAGREKAMRVMRKHRLAERLLTDVIRLDWDLVHIEACRWEHVMSDLVERRLVGLLDHPYVDPYGNPIPGLGELGEQYESNGSARETESLASLVAEGTRHGSDEDGFGTRAVIVRRIGEPLQVESELLTRFAAAGVLPGRRVDVHLTDSLISVTGEGSDTVLDLPDELARHLFVESAD